MLHDGRDQQRKKNLEWNRVEYKEQGIFQTVSELEIERRILIQQNRLIIVQTYPSLIGNQVPLCE